MLLTAFLLAASPVSCGDQPNQLAATMCFGEEAKRADVEMNGQWRRTLAAMQVRDRDDGPPPKSEPSFAAALLASQRAWLGFRDAECRIESYENRGGSVQAMGANQCFRDVTRARTKQLRELIWER